MSFKIAQKVTQHFGIFCKKLCHQELSKIVQSGHTVGPLNTLVNKNKSYLYPAWNRVSEKVEISRHKKLSPVPIPRIWYRGDLNKIVPNKFMAGGVLGVFQSGYGDT